MQREAPIVYLTPIFEAQSVICILVQEQIVTKSQLRYPTIISDCSLFDKPENARANMLLQQLYEFSNISPRSNNLIYLAKNTLENKSFFTAELPKEHANEMIKQFDGVNHRFDNKSDTKIVSYELTAVEAMLNTIITDEGSLFELLKWLNNKQ